MSRVLDLGMVSNISLLSPLQQMTLTRSLSRYLYPFPAHSDIYRLRSSLLGTYGPCVVFPTIEYRCSFAVVTARFELAFIPFALCTALIPWALLVCYFILWLP